MTKKVTLKDVAKHAGVSYQTVSKVLRKQKHVTPEVYGRIQTAVRELDYRPNVAAQNLRTQSSRLLGYCWAPWQHDYFNPILEQFQQGIIEAAEEHDYHILMFPIRKGEDNINAYRDLVMTGRVDGFILSGMEYNDPRIAMLQSLNVPLVAFGQTDSDEIFPFVDVDNAIGTYNATKHLLEQGHRKIAVLAWPEDSRVGSERLNGYLRAMDDARLPVASDWILRGGGDLEFGRTSTMQLLDLPASIRPTAIVTMLDMMAVGAAQAIQARGMQVGRDVAVTGYDNIPSITFFKPGLTTLSQPAWEAGCIAAAMLIKLLNGEPVEEQQVLLPPKLIIRESSLGFVPAE